MHKYRARRTTIDNIKFASAKEARRYCDLKILERAGKISGLTLQPKFPLVVNGKLVCTYIADFAYAENGAVIYEDVKGMKTPIYRIKIKLLTALHPNLTVREI